MINNAASDVRTIGEQKLTVEMNDIVDTTQAGLSLKCIAYAGAGKVHCCVLLKNITLRNMAYTFSTINILNESQEKFFSTLLIRLKTMLSNVGPKQSLSLYA
jgi:hypothetical protein